MKGEINQKNINKTVLVTGGAGFIGSNTVRLLCDRGYKVIVFDNLSTGYRHFVDNRAQFIKGDLRNSKEINKALKEVDYVFHFAATSIIKLSLEDPVGCYTNNIIGAINLLEGMRKNKVQHLVNSSSAAVYGESKKGLIGEDSVKKPLQPYGSSKLAIEAILSSYYYAYGINSSSLRYFNVFGPFDEQQPVTRAVPNWIKAILENEPILLYWKGNQLRDYIFVEDVALAHLAVMKLKGFNYFNIGSGKGILMIDLLESIFKAIGKKTEIVDLGERPGDPMHLVADTSKINDTVGWTVKFSLHEGLNKTIDYYRSKFNNK